MDERVANYLREINIAPEQIDGWAVEVVQRAGRDVGLFASKGSEVHFVSLAPRLAMSRKNTLQFLEPIYNAFGFVTTRVPITETDHKLRDRLGFTETWADEHFRYFAMTELPFQKELTP